jgi:hypothetical protein
MYNLSPADLDVPDSTCRELLEHAAIGQLAFPTESCVFAKDVGKGNMVHFSTPVSSIIQYVLELVLSKLNHFIYSTEKKVTFAKKPMLHLCRICPSTLIAKIAPLGGLTHGIGPVTPTRYLIQ